MAEFIGDLLLRAGIELSGLDRDLTRMQAKLSAFADSAAVPTVTIDVDIPDVAKQGQQIGQQLAKGVSRDQGRVKDAITEPIIEAVAESQAIIDQAAADLGSLEPTTPPVYWDEWAAQVRTATAAADELAAAQARLSAAEATGTPGTPVEDPAIRAQRERLELAEYTAKRESEIRQQRLAEEAAAAAQSLQIARNSLLEQVRLAESALEFDDAALREAVFRGLVSPKEAQEAAKINAEAYNAAILAALDQGRAAEAAGIPVFKGQEGEKAFAAVAGSLRELDDESRRSVVGLGRLNNAMVTVARQAAGAHPVVGQLVDVVGTFALGTGVMVGVLAGLTALAYGYKALTKESREAKEEAEKLADRIAEIARIQRLGIGGQLGADIATTRRDMDEITRRLAEIQELSRQTTQPEVAIGRERFNLAEANFLRQEAIRLTEELAQKERDYQTLIRQQGEVALGNMADRLRQANQAVELAGLDGVDRALAAVDFAAQERLIEAHRTLTGELLNQEKVVIEMVRQREREAILIQEARGAAEKMTATVAETNAFLREASLLQPFNLLDASQIPTSLRESLSLIDTVRSNIEDIGRRMRAVREAGGLIDPREIAEMDRLRAGLATLEEEFAATTERIRARWDTITSAMESNTLDIVPQIATGSLSLPIDPRSIADRLQRAYDQAIAMTRLSAAQGLIDEESFRAQGKEAAEALNKGLVEQIQRLLDSGQIEEAIKLSGSLQIDFEVEENAREKAVQAAREATEAFNEDIAAANEVVSSFGDLADSADALGEGFARVLRGIETFLSGIAKINYGSKLAGGSTPTESFAANFGAEFGNKLAEGFTSALSNRTSGFGGFSAGFRPFDPAPTPAPESEPVDTGLLGSLSQIAGVMTVAAGAIQIVGGIFERSEWERAIENNSRALRDLQLELEGFRITPPVTVAAGQAGAAAAADKNLGGGLLWSTSADVDRKILSKFLADFGLSLDQFAKIAEDKGIQLFDASGNVIVPALQQFADVLGVVVERLTGFDDTLAGRQQERDLRDRLLGVERNPEQQVSALFDDLGAIAPDLFRRFFDGIDLTDVEAARRAAVKMFDAFAADEAGFAEMMGGLTREEFLGWIGQAADGFADMTKAVDDAVGALVNVPQGFRVLNLELARFNAMQRQRAEDLLPAPPPPPVTTGGGGQTTTPDNRRPPVPSDPGQEGPYRDRPNVTQNLTFNVSQQPGESPEDFARRIEEVMRRLNREAGLTYANDPYAYGPV